MRRRDKYKPAVPIAVLLLLAGLLWASVGTMLLGMAFGWLAEASGPARYAYATAGVALALLAYYAGFSRIAARNVSRLSPIEGKKCLFAFMPWKSYLLIPLMISMGGLLRHAPIAKPALSVLYIGMGLALLLSSARYLNAFLNSRTTS